jgi:hypothetical protein
LATRCITPPCAATATGLFFKDLTKVEQLEERAPARSGALGEMAAAIAHE